jgi:hypothetical protein
MNEYIENIILVPNDDTLSTSNGVGSIKPEV